MSCIYSSRKTKGDSDLPDKTAEQNHSQKFKKCLKFLEVLMLLCVELVVVGLFTIPTVYYALPDIVKVRHINLTSKKKQHYFYLQQQQDGDLSCSEVVAYSGSVCSSELSSLQTCFSGLSSSPPKLSIPSTINQQQGEGQVINFLAGLDLFFDASSECMTEVKPFLCLRVFPLCDASGNFHVPSQGECSRLRDSLCSSAWMQAENVLPPGTLPVCEELPNVTNVCSGGYVYYTISSW